MLSDAARLASVATKPLAYLTTSGRLTARPHRIEIWFAVDGGRVYLMSGSRARSDWVRNIQHNPDVTIEIGGETFAGIATIVESDTPEDQRARELLVAKYATPSNTLAEWKQRSLPVKVEFLEAT